MNFVSVYGRLYAFKYKKINFLNVDWNCLARHKKNSNSLTEACNFDQISEFCLLGHASLIGVKTKKCIVYSVKSKRCRICSLLKRKIVYLKK